MREANSFDIFLLVLLGLIWGSSFFNIKIATYSYEPITLALVRVIFASAPLILLCKFKKYQNRGFFKRMEALCFNRSMQYSNSIYFNSYRHK